MKEHTHKKRKHRIEENLPEEVEQIVVKEKLKLHERLKDNGRKRVQQLVYGRTLLIILLLLLQLTLLFAMFNWMKDYSSAIYALLEVCSIVVVIVVINRQENPMFKLTWVILILALPVLGAMLYVFVQSQAGVKLASYKTRLLNKETEKYLEQSDEVMSRLSMDNPHLKGVAGYIHRACGHPVYQHSKVDYFPIGEEYFRQLLIDLNNAKEFIFLEYFIIKEGIMWSSILEILKKKAAEGVEVRVMYDGLCTFTDVPAGYYKTLWKYGIKGKVFGSIRPILTTVQNNRDHRKIAVIDGQIAYTGGVNLADEYINEINRFGHWKDTGIRITGEAVQSFTVMFLNTWNGDELRREEYRPYLKGRHSYGNITNDGFVIPYGDCPFDEYNVAKHIYLNAISCATDYVHIMTPYLILDNETIETLCFAADRGVDVKIILPHVPDKKYAFWLAKSYYKELLLAGVKIYEYIPGFVHAKGMVADGRFAVVGSSNFDFRSFYLHYECGLLMYRNSAIGEVEQDMQKTLSRCKEVILEDLKYENGIVKLVGKVLRLVAPLM